MKKLRNNEPAKRTARKVGLTKTTVSAGENVSRQPEGKGPRRSMLQIEPSSVEQPCSPTGPVLIQEEFRARIARKAFELYEKRQALTEMDDWLEAERLVKHQLLSEQQGGLV